MGIAAPTREEAWTAGAGRFGCREAKVDGTDGSGDDSRSQEERTAPEKEREGAGVDRDGREKACGGRDGITGGRWRKQSLVHAPST